MSALALLLGTIGVAVAALPSLGETQKVSVDAGGGDPNGENFAPVISAKGRYVAFMSDASDLVADDGNGVRDIFVRDLSTGVTSRVSVDEKAGDANNASYDPAISADGRYVTFRSLASDLVGNDGNGLGDVFVRDLLSGTTERVSVDVLGDDADGESSWSAISDDGRYVAFSSVAGDLVEDDKNGRWDIFVRDLDSGTTQRVSVDTGGSDANSDSDYPDISATGRYVAFHSDATDLIASDGNTWTDVFVRDLQLGETRRVSEGSRGAAANGDSLYPAISADGRIVAFSSYASDLVPSDGNDVRDVFAKDLKTGAMTRVSVDMHGGDAVSGANAYLAISADGGSVAFSSTSNDIVMGDSNDTTDVFIRDLAAGRTRRASVDADGYDANDASWRPTLSDDGRYAAFESYASDLLPGGASGFRELFVRNVPFSAEIQHDAAGVTFDRWVTGYSTAYSGGGYVYGRWTGTRLDAEFTGSRIKWIGPLQPSYGKADVYIDDVLMGSGTDCYASDADKTLEAMIWDSGPLASDGPHTISIRLVGERNAASTGNYVVIDRFEVTGGAPAGGGARIDDSAAAPGYTGTWLPYANPTYFNKTYAYSRWTNAAFTAAFTGTKVAWIGPRTPHYGMADVYIDDVKVATVDCYRADLATQGWREIVWESDALAPGAHTIAIKPLGTMNLEATAANVVIDAIDVRP